jgi:hypothetical protein
VRSSPRRDVAAGPREMVTEAIGREVVLDVKLVVRRRGVHAADHVGTNDLDSMSSGPVTFKVET